MSTRNVSVCVGIGGMGHRVPNRIIKMVLVMIKGSQHKTTIGNELIPWLERMFIQVTSKKLNMGFDLSLVKKNRPTLAR